MTSWRGNVFRINNCLWGWRDPRVTDGLEFEVFVGMLLVLTICLIYNRLAGNLKHWHSCDGIVITNFEKRYFCSPSVAIYSAYGMNTTWTYPTKCSRQEMLVTIWRKNFCIHLHIFRYRHFIIWSNIVQVISFELVRVFWKICRDLSFLKFSPAVVINTCLYIIKILYYFDTNNVLLTDLSLIDFPLNYQVPGILCECPTSGSVGDRPATRANVSLLFWLDRFVSGVNTLGASCQIRKIACCACTGNAGNVSPAMHHGTCVTHVPWCISGSLISGFLWSRWWGKRSWHSRRMRNTQCCVYGKRPMVAEITVACVQHFWDRNKMGNIWNIFCWKKHFVCWSNFNWSLFLWSSKTLCQYRFVPIVIAWSCVAEPYLRRDMTSLGQNELLMVSHGFIGKISRYSQQCYICGLYFYGSP